MFQTVSRLLPEVLLILVTAVATHLVRSFAQTLGEAILDLGIGRPSRAS